jgi:hypothetical protein
VKKADTEEPMKRGTKAGRSNKRLVTTLGDIISAAYEAVPGMGDKKLERALTLLTRSPLARHMSPHVEFVR